MPEKQPPRRVLRAVYEHPWAILPSRLDALIEVVELRASGVQLSREEIEARLAAAQRSPQTASSPGAVAVLPLVGVLAQRMDMFSEMSGGTSTERFAAAFRGVIDDPNISAVVIDVDSPGGSVYGIEELGNVIYGARGTKPVVAIANSMAASAAYWIASQADEFVVTPSGEVGSIGVIAYHDDISKMAEDVGLRRTYITAGRYKAEGNPFEPLLDEARDFLQGRVDEYYDAFVKSVARGRGVNAAKVRKDFGEGRMYGARQAIAVGMADREDTLQGVINRLAARKRKSSARAEAQAEENPAVPVEALAALEPGTDAQLAAENEPPIPDPQPPAADRELALARLRLAEARGAA